MIRSTHILVLLFSLAAIIGSGGEAAAAPVFASLDLAGDELFTEPASWSSSSSQSASTSRTRAHSSQLADEPHVQHPLPAFAASAASGGMSSQITTSSTAGPASLPASAPVCFSASSIPLVMAESLQLPPPLANRLFRPPRHAC